jgi:hypothetical protein
MVKKGFAATIPFEATGNAATHVRLILRTPMGLEDIPSIMTSLLTVLALVTSLSERCTRLLIGEDSADHFAIRILPATAPIA